MTVALAAAPPPAPRSARARPLGRAARESLDGGRELLWLEAGDAALAARLVELGRAGVGGVTEGGLWEGAPWLARARGGQPVSARLQRGAAKAERLSPDRVVAVARDLFGALAALEQRSLFPGPLQPQELLLGAEPPSPGRACTLLADELVGALLGAPGAAEAPAGLLLPPEQAAGEPWGAAANRYVAALVVYLLAAGEHPFAGGGLRHALDAAASEEAPPFPDEVRAALPPGFQALVLSLLHPEPGARPASARAVVERLDGLGGGPRPRRAEGRKPRAEPERAPPDAPRPAPRRAEPAPRPPRPRGWAGWAALAAAAVGASALLAWSALAPAPPAAASPVRAALRPFGPGETRATDCAACHAREAMEWRRSVMAHSVRSPLFLALESLVEEQIGRDRDCPNGAGALRKVDPRTACRTPQGFAVTGSGGEHWCVSCHAPGENLAARMPAWDGSALGDARSRRPVSDLLGDAAMEGISCAFCHQVHGPVGRRGSGRYEGNPTWTSFVTGATFATRPEDDRGLLGIGNSGYRLRTEELLLAPGGAAVEPAAHARPSPEAKRFLGSSEFCGSCHDVRLFGTDVLGAPQRGEHFKRLRNAYSEWADWAKGERRAGREPASCQDCHMSLYPGTCEPGDGDAGPGCPSGTRFAPKAPGERPRRGDARVSPHYFSGVDLPLSADYPAGLVDEPGVDAAGLPLSLRARRDLLLRSAVSLEVRAPRRLGARLEVPVVIENVGAGHRVPAGFSQERELWVELVVKDARGRPVYEVGRLGRPDEDLRDKTFLRVSTDPDVVDGLGRPLGLFGADVADGPDAPRWSPAPQLGGTRFRGLGLVNFQNGFLRCVRCIGVVAADGTCEPGPGQGAHRADRFADGDYDLDTGACTSNLPGTAALFETYFPVGALDASRGVPKAPDAIVDTRSLPPKVPVTYTYDLPIPAGRQGPFTVEARLLFRAFPPYLVRAFASYEAAMARRGLRPSGPLVTSAALARLEIVELARRRAEVP